MTVGGGISGASSVTINDQSSSHLTINGGISGVGVLTVAEGSSASLAINGGISASGNVAITVGSSATFSVAGGIVDTGVFTLTEGTSANATIGGGISGVSSVTITNQSSSHLTINDGISASGNVTITEGSSATLAINGGIVGSGVLAITEGSSASATISGPVSGLSGITWNVGSSANATLSADVSGDTDLTKTGSGTLTLSGHNTFTGTTTISTGTLKLTTSDALAGSTLAYTTTGGSIDYGTLTSLTLGGLSGNKNIVLTNTAAQAVALTVGGNNSDTTYSGVLSGLGSFTKAGYGTMTLAGSMSNTYAGETTVAGTLILAKTGGAIAIPGNVFMGETGDGTSTFLILEGDNEIATSASVMTFSTPVAWAHFDLNGHQQTLAGLHSDPWAVIEGRWDNTGLDTDSQLTINNESDSEFLGTIRDAWTGTGTGKLKLVKTGSGTLTLAGAGTGLSTGGITVNGGKLVLQDVAPSSDIIDNATLEINTSGADVAYGGVISGTGNVTKTGGQTLTLAGDSSNTYGGATAILAGNVNLAKTSGYAISGDLNFNGAGQTFLNLLGDNQIAPTAKLSWNGGGDGWQEVKLLGHTLTVAGISDTTGWAVIENSWDETGYGDSTLTVNNPTECTFNGIIRDTALGDGKLNLVKAGAGTLTLVGGSTGGFTGNASIAAESTVTYYQDGCLWVGNSFSGSGTVKFTGPGGTADGYVGDYELGGDNSNFTGAIIVDDVRIRDHNGPQNFGAATINVLSGGQILVETSGATYTNDLTLSGIGWLEGGNVSYGASRYGGTTWAGDIHLAGDARVVPTLGVGTITGNISGDYTLEQGGCGGWDGTTILAPTSGNTFAALKISGGTVRFGADNALSAGALVQVGSPISPCSWTSTAMTS